MEVEEVEEEEEEEEVKVEEKATVRARNSILSHPPPPFSKL